MATVQLLPGTSPSEAGSTAIPGNFTVTLDAPAPAGGLTVSYTVGGTATAGTDYTALSGSVTIAEGATSATIDVTPALDSVTDPNETVSVTLTATADYTLGAAKSAVLIIGDNGPKSFTQITGTGNPLNGVSVGSYSTPTFADIDGDSDLDAFIGSFNGNIQYYRNDGSGTFTHVTGTANPLSLVALPGYSAPALGDIDGDGDLDAFVGEYNGAIYSYRNDGGTFVQAGGTDNPFNGVDTGLYAAPTIADIDSDNDPDVFLLSGSTIQLYRNDGGTLTQVTGTANPLDGVSVGQSTFPTFADIDGDGDLDAFIGNRGGSIFFYRNDSGTFTQVTGTGNPFDGVGVGLSSKPTFADIDKDGDLDAFIGAGDGTIRYFENAAKVTISAGTAPAEAGPTDGTFTVTLADPAPDTGITISYTVGGTATSGTDYTALSGTVTFAASETTATIIVTPVDDTDVDAGETVSITLTDTAEYNVGTAATAELTIADNDVANTAPTIAANAGLTVAEGAAAQTIANTALNVTDAEQAAAQLTYTVTALPAQGTLLLNGTAMAVSGTFTQADIDAGNITYTHNGSETTSDSFTFTVADGAGGTVTATTFNITVTPANDAPTAGTIADQGSLAQDTPFTLDVSASFSDADGQTLSYSATGLPNGLTIDPATGIISGSPTSGGTFTATVTADDGNGGTVTDDFVLTVAGANNAPAVTSPIADQGSLAQDTPFTLDVSASFSDADGQTLSYSATGLPNGLTIDPATGIISGSPTAGGTFTATVTADDGNGGTVTDDFVLTVAGAPDAPVVTTAIADQNNLTEDTPFTLDVSSSFSDPNGDTLTYAAAGLPDGLTIDPATGIISGSPTAGGTFTATVTADDGNGGTVTDDFVLTVAGANNAPAVTSPIADQASLTQDTPFTLDVSASFSDADGQTLSYSATGLPNGLTIDPATGIISGSPTAGGTFTATVTADDGNGGTVTDDFVLTVAGANNA
ncbi:MAG: VCBS repeat-containing protein, partial [Oscillatoria princeps RMCB-10]|nr:VCBS repeat-containing protein [Oscillatoria princeps RMCB-10]